MLNIYICEDNDKQREFFASFISDYCVFRNLDADVVLATASPTEVIDHNKQAQSPALFFLDIELGEDAKFNGMELARRIRKEGGKAFIVFLTTHSEMTMLTFEYKIEALDFIIKDKQENIKMKIAECINTVLERGMAADKGNTLRVTVDDKVIFINISEIFFIETTHIRHKLRLHMKKRTLEFNGELKTMEEQLDERFIRCHKSCIVNREKISVINKKENTLMLSNNSTCPLSRTGKKLLADA